MKKLFALLLALVMMMSLVACGENPDGTTTNPANPANPTNPTNPTNPSEPTNPTNPSEPTNPEGKVPASAVALLNEMFANVPEDIRYVVDVETGDYYLDENGEKMSVFNGGSFLFDEEGIPYYPGVNAAGAIDMTTEGALFTLFVGEEHYANVEEAASLFHGQNGNTFTSGALKLKEGTDMAALAKSVRDAIAGNFWMCGIPDRFVVASVGNYLVIVYGHDGVGDENYKTTQVVTPFVKDLATMYPNAEILFDEMIGG